MSKDNPNSPKQLVIQVPKNVNLVEMSNEEIEKLALEMSRKAATGFPKESEVLGVERLVLASAKKPDVDVWGSWSRACGKADLTREGLVVNPEVFEEAVREAPSMKSVIQSKGIKK
jgi:hypothetical protein